MISRLADENLTASVGKPALFLYRFKLTRALSIAHFFTNSNVTSTSPLLSIIGPGIRDVRKGRVP
jgi:hypothetical protein